MNKLKLIPLFLTMVIVILLTGCKSAPDPASQKVIDDISSIGTVQLSDQALISRIEKTYAALSESQKNQVTNYIILIEAREELDELIAANEKRIAEQAKLTAIEKSAYQAVLAIKSNLRDPNSMELISIKVDTNAVVGDSIAFDCIFEIEYSATNGFGGTVREVRYIPTYNGSLTSNSPSETTLSIVFDAAQTINISRIEAAIKNPSLAQ